MVALTSLSRLALEVKYLDRARSFYVDRLGLDPVRETGTELAFSVGETELVVRRPTGVPRGGLHVHYAFTAPAAAYDDWLDRLAALDPEEMRFGSSRSLYVDDPDDHCVEIGGTGEGGGDGDGEGDDSAGDRAGAPPLTGIFEAVLEVADLDRAEAFYRALGFEAVDRGAERRRVRLRGPFDLELWEPQLGIADARGGVHVDLGVTTDDPAAAADAVADRACAVERRDEAALVVDPDGHRVTFRSPE